MVTKVLLDQLTEKESRLAHQMIKKKKDIQLVAANGEESCTVIDDTSLEPFNLILGIVSKEGKLCIGRYGKVNYSFHSSQSSNLTRVWIDCRDQEGIKFHVNTNGQFYKLSEDEEEHDHEDKLVIVFLHCPDFVQLSLYDGQLAFRKLSHIFSTGQASEKIKTIAYSMLNQHFPGVSKHLLQLEGERDGL